MHGYFGKLWGFFYPFWPFVHMKNNILGHWKAFEKFLRGEDFYSTCVFTCGLKQQQKKKDPGLKKYPFMCHSLGFVYQWEQISLIWPSQARSSGCEASSLIASCFNLLSKPLSTYSDQDTADCHDSTRINLFSIATQYYLTGMVVVVAMCRSFPQHH